MRSATLRICVSALFTSLALPSMSSAQALQSPTVPAQNIPAVERSRQLKAFFEEYWQDNLAHSPETATFLGDKRYNGKWSDYSIAGVQDQLRREREFMLRLAAIDTTGLSEQEKLSSVLLMRTFVEDQEGAKFKDWEMPITQFGGFHTLIPMLASATAFDTTKDYDDYLARLNGVPHAFSQVMEVMDAGVRDNRIPPKFLLEKALEQVKSLTATKPEDSPFATMLKKFPASVSDADQKRLREAILKAIETQVYPSYLRLATYMQSTYIPKGRVEPGTWSIPDGEAYYAYLVRRSTTLDKTPDEIHQIGLDEVKKDEAAMLVIAKKLGYNDLKSFNAAIKSDPKLHPTSKQQLLDIYKKYLNQMQAKLPQLFTVLPKAPVEVMEVPAYAAKQQAAAYYLSGTPDGKRPGRIYINTYQFADRGLEGVEAIAYHEGIPGHHLQISVAQELTGIPEFRKQSYYTAYTEGWGLYAEHLGKDVGFYQDPYSNYGRLEADIWRAIRLVVDTGVHSKHWTRQQMVDFFHDHSSIDETNVQSEVDRYIAIPSQALGYKMGQLKFLELRERAYKQLGPKFDIKKFHDFVIDSGALPLNVLDQRVNDWIKSQQ